MQLQHTILALDCATGPASVAIMRQGKILAQAQDSRPHEQARALVPLIQDTVVQAGITFADIDILSTTSGPGSFTGIRLGLATARGLALAMEKPLYSFTTLQIMAFEAAALTHSERILSCLHAGKGQAYVQLFERKDSNALTEPAVMDFADIKKFTNDYTIAVGNAVDILMPLGIECLDTITHPAAASLALFCAVQCASPQMVCHTPLYIRAPDAKLPSKDLRSPANKG